MGHNKSLCCIRVRGDQKELPLFHKLVSGVEFKFSFYISLIQFRNLCWVIYHCFQYVVRYLIITILCSDERRMFICRKKLCPTTNWNNSASTLYRSKCAPCYVTYWLYSLSMTTVRFQETGTNAIYKCHDNNHNEHYFFNDTIIETRLYTRTRCICV